MVFCAVFCFWHTTQVVIKAKVCVERRRGRGGRASQGQSNIILIPYCYSLYWSTHYLEQKGKYVYKFVTLTNFFDESFLLTLYFFVVLMYGHE